MSVLSVYRAFRNKFVDALMVIAALVLVAHQVSAARGDYAEQFRQIASTYTAEHNPTVQRYLSMVSNLHDVDLAAEVDALYADQLYYSDTFLVASDRSEVLAHFQGLRDAGATIDLTVHDMVASDSGIYLVWSADNTFEVLGRSTTAASIGVTMFMLDQQGKISVQQDFWDSTQGFYQHLPVIGGALRTIRNEIASG